MRVARALFARFACFGAFQVSCERFRAFQVRLRYIFKMPTQHARISKDDKAHDIRSSNTTYLDSFGGQPTTKTNKDDATSFHECIGWHLNRFR